MIAAALAAALPPAAAAEPTTAEVTIPLGAGTFGAFLASPGPAPAPIVLVAGGGAATSPAVRDVCQRLAQAGYLALAPDDGPNGDVGALGRLQASAGWAASHGGAAHRLFVTGFGPGGRLVWLFASQSRSLRAGVAWGSTPGTGQTTGPIDVAEALRAPVLGLYGADDPANSRTALLDLEHKGRASGHAVEIVAYTGVGATFALPGQPGYDQAAAMDGWTRMMAWFRRFGGK